jgi:hypothetical protein
VVNLGQEVVPWHLGRRCPSAALAAVLDNQRLAGDLRSAALAVCERFSWARSASEHQAIYAALSQAA